MEGEVREVAEVDEEVLASSRGVIEGATVDECGIGCEPTLRTRHVDRLAAERPVESGGQGMDRVALRHVRGWGRSP